MHDQSADVDISRYFLRLGINTQTVPHYPAGTEVTQLYPSGTFYAKGTLAAGIDGSLSEIYVLQDAKQRGFVTNDNYALKIEGTTLDVISVGSRQACSFSAGTNYLFKSLTIQIPGVVLNDETLVHVQESLNITATATSVTIKGRVHLKADRSMVIYGRLDGNGRGYSSDEGPLNLNLPGRETSNGAGHGGSHAGAGDGQLNLNNHRSTYGSFQYPVTMGSGGGSSTYSMSGGAGGAAVHLETTGKLIIGQRGKDENNLMITMDGNNGQLGEEYIESYGCGWSTCYRYWWEGGGGGGAGGSILIEADIIQMTGLLSAAGGMGARNTKGHNARSSVSKPSNRQGGKADAGCGGGGRIAIHCERKWNGASSKSENWNALDMVANSPPNVYGYKVSHPRPGGPGTVYFDCGNHRQELVIDYSPSGNMKDEPWSPTVISAEKPDGEVELNTLELGNGAQLMLGPVNLIDQHNDQHQDLVPKDSMMQIHIGRILQTGRKLDIPEGRVPITVTAGAKVILRQTKSAARPYRITYDASPTARWNTLVSAADGTIVGAYSARSVVGTEACQLNESLSGVGADGVNTCQELGGPCGLGVSGPGGDTAWSWTHRYPPIVQPITRATLRIDCGDCDGGTIRLRSVVNSVPAVELGTVTGGDHAVDDAFKSGEYWACPDEWCQSGLGSDCSSGSDNLIEMPPSTYEDLRDGSFEIEVWRVQGTGHWASNRAILEISTSIEHSTAFKKVANPHGKTHTNAWSLQKSKPITFPVMSPLVYEITRTSTQIAGSTYALTGNVVVQEGATLVTPPVLDITAGNSFTLGGHLQGAQNIVIRGEGAKMILQHRSTGVSGNFPSSKAGRYYWQTLTVSSGGELETANVEQIITARSINFAASENTGLVTTITAHHTLELIGHHIEIGAEAKIDGYAKGYPKMEGPGAATGYLVANNGGKTRGASHGGVGAGQPWIAGGLGGYGSIRRPRQRGSGGFGYGSGGAAIIIKAVDELSFIKEHTRIQLNGSMKAGLVINRTSAGSSESVFNTSALFCSYSAPDANVPISFVPSGTNRLLALDFDRAELNHVGPGKSTMTDSDILVIGSPLVSSENDGAGNNSNVTDRYSRGWSLSTYESNTNILSHRGDGIQLSTYEDAWRINSPGFGSRTFISWYKGAQTEAKASQHDNACGITIFGDYDMQTSVIALGVNEGKVAVCMGGKEMKNQGDSLVTDNEWHMLAWVYDESSGLLHAFADPLETMTEEVSFNASSCGIDGLCRIYAIGNGPYGTGTTEAPLALDDIQIYDGALSKSELQDIRNVYASQGSVFPHVSPNGCSENATRECHPGIHRSIPLLLDDCQNEDVTSCAAPTAIIYCDDNSNIHQLKISDLQRGSGMQAGQILKMQASLVGGISGSVSFPIEESYLTDKDANSSSWPYFDSVETEISRGKAFLKIDGEIDVSAGGDDSGAGSGGSIQIRSSGSLLGIGTLKANGGDGTYSGGGGRISVHCNCLKEDSLRKFAYGGMSSGNPKRPGGAGTVYVNYTDFPNHLSIENDGLKRSYRGFTDVMMADNKGFATPQVHDDGIGSGASHGSKAGYVRDFSLDVEGDPASMLRRDFSSRIPTTLVFSSEDSSIDFGALNQTTFHTLEVTNGAHAVLTAVGVEVNSVPSLPISWVFSVHRLIGDGYGRLRVSSQMTLIVREEDLDYEFGQDLDIEVLSNSGNADIVQLQSRSSTTTSNAFELDVHLAIENGARIITPKAVISGKLNVPMRHHWGGLWSGVQSFVLDKMQEFIVAGSASTSINRPGKIELKGSLTIARGSKWDFRRCDLDSFCDHPVELTISNFLKISNQGFMNIQTKAAVNCPHIQIGETPSSGRSQLLIKGGQPVVFYSKNITLHSGSQIDGDSGGHQVRRVGQGAMDAPSRASSESSIVHPGYQIDWDDNHGYGQGLGSFESHAFGGIRTEGESESRLGYGGSHGGVGGYMYISRTVDRQYKYEGGDPPIGETGGSRLGYGSYIFPNNMGLE